MYRFAIVAFLAINACFLGSNRLFSQSFTIDKQPFYVSTYQGLEVKMVPEFNAVAKKGLFGSDEYIVQLTSLGVANNLFGPPTYIDYKGKRYYWNEFDDQLKPFFNSLAVVSVDVLHETQSFEDCSYLQGWNMLKVGGKFSGFCKPKDPNKVAVRVTGLIIRSMSGVRELQQKIDALEEKARKVKEQIKTLEKNAANYMALKDYELAIANYEEILFLDPNNVLAQRNLSKAQNNLQLVEKSTKNNTSNNTTKNTGAKNTSAGVATNLTNALNLDAQAARLIQQGNIQQGVNLYKQAQQLSYSEERAKQINYYTMYQGASQLSQGMNQLFDNLDASTKEIDPEGKLSWMYFMAGYEKSFLNNELNNPIPETAFIGFSTDLFIFFNLQFRGGWMQTPSIIYDVEGRLGSPTTGTFTSVPEEVSINQNGYFAGMAAGLNVPLSAFWDDKRPYLLLSANYGFDYLFAGEDSVVNNDFEIAEGEDFSTNTLTRLSVSLAYQFPKSKFGLSLFYNAYNLKPIEFSQNLSYIGANSFYQGRDFRTNGATRFNTSQIDGFSTFGISLIYVTTNRK